mmetsp:Transcript_29101/g.53052  ORF Transcript_29101/g.53052 Transcript_29101/m.53052 type:complete len:739 (+) Transcript_29101:33-2249(+)
MLAATTNRMSSVCKEQLQHAFLDHAKSRRWTMVKAMLDEQPDLVNVHPGGRWSALHQAAASGCREAVELLLARRADPGLKNSAGASAAELASTEDIRRVIADAQSSPMEHAFLDRAKLRDWKAVSDMLAKHPHLVNACPAKRWSALHQASMAGNEDVVRFLLRSRADPTLRAADGRTAADVAMSASLKSLLTSVGSVGSHSAAPTALAPMELVAPSAEGAPDRRASFAQSFKRPSSKTMIEIIDSDEGTQDNVAEVSSGLSRFADNKASTSSAEPPRAKLPRAENGDGRQQSLMAMFARGASREANLPGVTSLGDPSVSADALLHLGSGTSSSSAAGGSGAVGAASGAASGGGTGRSNGPEDLPLPALPAPSVIQKKQGTFSIGAPGAGRRMGAYSFDDGTRELRDEMELLLGVFGDSAVAARPFPMEILRSPERAPLKLPCISVVSSEVVEEVQNPCNDGAFFVLPSQLNGAEYPSERNIVTRLEDYKYDRTGGPRGQLAVHPASGQFMLDNAACDHRPDGINAVDHLLRAARASMQSTAAKHYDMHLKNGYLVLPHCDAATQVEVIQGLSSALHTLRCLAMRNVQACGLAPSFTTLSSASHKVSLVFASAVPVDAYMNRVRSTDQLEFQTEVGRLFLIAQYYGALRAAVAEAGPPRRVFLMPLGGGVFNNRLEVIVGAISTAVDLLVHDGCDVQAKLEIFGLAFKGKPSEKVDMESLFSRFGKLGAGSGGRAPSAL